jgi:hypothetical protein
MSSFFLFWSAINIFPKIFFLSTMRILMVTQSLNAITLVPLLGLFEIIFKIFFSKYFIENSLPFVGKFLHREKSWMLFAQICSCFSFFLILNSTEYIYVIYATILSILSEGLYNTASAKFQIKSGITNGPMLFFNSHKIATIVSNILSLIIFGIWGYKITVIVMLFFAILGIIPIFYIAPDESFIDSNIKKFIISHQESFIAFIGIIILFSLFIPNKMLWFVKFSISYIYYFIANNMFANSLKNQYPYIQKFGAYILIHVICKIFFQNYNHFFSFNIFLLSSSLCLIFNFFLDFIFNEMKIYNYLSKLLSPIMSFFKNFFFSDERIHQEQNVAVKHVKYIVLSSTGGVFFFVLSSIFFRTLESYYLMIFNYISLFKGSYIPFYIIYFIFIVFFCIKVFLKRKEKDKILRSLSEIDQYWGLIIFIFFFKSAKMFNHGFRNAKIFHEFGVNNTIFNRFVVLLSGVIGGNFISKFFSLPKFSTKKLCIIGSIISLTDVFTNIAAMSSNRVLSVVGIGMEHVINGVAIAIMMLIISRAASKEKKSFLHPVLWGVYSGSSAVFQGISGPLLKLAGCQTLEEIDTVTASIFMLILVVIPFIISLTIKTKNFEISEKTN